MIMLTKDDLYVNCVCGTRFVSTQGDFKMNPVINQWVVQCPNCGNLFYIITKELEVKQQDIEGEKVEDDSKSEV